MLILFLFCAGIALTQNIRESNNLTIYSDNNGEKAGAGEWDFVQVVNGISQNQSETVFFIFLISSILFFVLGIRYAKNGSFWSLFVISIYFFVISTFGLHCLLLWYHHESKELCLFWTWYCSVGFSVAFFVCGFLGINLWDKMTPNYVKARRICLFFLVCVFVMYKWRCKFSTQGL